ncbi:hypothetical protein P154DRAFT_299651 [Amniculicola lignicola CBS 123094]|uniref:Uncharacterized protein n=1 Tax=Amniculicola lignicola CBS 123094 TaxID=1392246 RepID=A0A6A5W740_9PLEO|nr:hypothetical protein P154DRAFT_299651 [Amniculicola lignicola CBS 123094]
MEDPISEHSPEADDFNGAKRSRFRFKSEAKRPRESEEPDDSDRGEIERGEKRQRSSRHNHDRRDRRESRRSRKDSERHRRKKAKKDTFVYGNGEYSKEENRHRESLYDGFWEDAERSADWNPDDAFRESLFDALADDEGAEYWEGVYGEPISSFPTTKRGREGELERMTDEEYVAHVRAEMFKRTPAGREEERKAHEAKRKEDREKNRKFAEEHARMESEHEAHRRRMEEALKRGEQRRQAKEAEGSWERYLRKWEALKDAQKMLEDPDVEVERLIPWPVRTGIARHVSPKDVEEFFETSPAWTEGPSAMLKIERVRWHPDKMQQRFGQHIDADTMTKVTAVFQVIDRLWTDRRR